MASAKAEPALNTRAILVPLVSCPPARLAPVPPLQTDWLLRSLTPALCSGRRPGSRVCEGHQLLGGQHRQGRERRDRERRGTVSDDDYISGSRDHSYLVNSHYSSNERNSGALMG